MELLQCTCYVCQETPIGKPVEIEKTVCLPNNGGACLPGLGRIVQFKFWRGSGDLAYEDIHRTSPPLSDEQFFYWLNTLVNTYPQIKKVGLIGSRAKGTATLKSDWDILISLDDACYKDSGRDMEREIAYDPVITSNATIDLWFLRPNGVIARHFKRNLKDSFFHMPGFREEDKTQPCNWPDENACCKNIWLNLYRDVSNALLLYDRPEFFIRIRKVEI